MYLQYGARHAGGAGQSPRASGGRAGARGGSSGVGKCWLVAVAAGEKSGGAVESVY